MKAPHVVASFIDAVNRGDASAVLGFFDPDTGVVVDAGRRFVGHQEIARWNEREFVGANGHLTTDDIQTAGQIVTIVGRWESKFYTGPTRFIFTLDGARIAELTTDQGLRTADTPYPNNQWSSVQDPRAEHSSWALAASFKAGGK